MTGSGETFIRCRYCGRLLNVGDLEPNEVYCKKCDRTFDVNECEVVLRGISCIPSDYHYEWEKETAYNLDAVINTPYIQIGGKQFKTKDFMEALKRLMEENENDR